MSGRNKANPGGPDKEATDEQSPEMVNLTTGAVGHRDLVLEQSMIMAALDNALRDRALQRDFASDPVSWAAHTYLSMETMSIAS